MFSNKASAYIYSATDGQPVIWNFADSVWKSAANSLTEKDTSIPLSVWYANRAIQLREKYDYLILNYSGGMDSWNILYTFLKNNILLDEIHVKNSASIDERISKISLSTESTNLMSEWHYTTLPDLKWVSNNYPNIKITIQDFFEHSKINLSNAETFAAAGHYVGAFELMRQTDGSPSVYSVGSKTIGEIWGIDKPSFHIMPDMSIGVYFVDSTINVPHRNSVSLSTQELFYYATDMPKLTFVQSVCCYKGMKLGGVIDDIFDINKRKFIPAEHRGEIWTQVKREIAKKYLYNECLTYRPRQLQVNKPTSFSTTSRSRDYHYDIHPETADIRSAWQRGWGDFTEQLKKPKTTRADDIFKTHVSNYYIIPKELL